MENKSYTWSPERELRSRDAYELLSPWLLETAHLDTKRKALLRYLTENKTIDNGTLWAIEKALTDLNKLDQKCGCQYTIMENYDEKQRNINMAYLDRSYLDNETLWKLDTLHDCTFKHGHEKDSTFMNKDPEVFRYLYRVNYRVYCKYCKVSSNNLEEFLKHLQGEYEISCYSCYSDSLKFSSIDDYLSHIYIEHGPSNDKFEPMKCKIACKKCTFSTDNLEKFFTHLGAQYRIECGLCNFFSFPDIDKYAEHLRLAHGHTGWCDWMMERFQGKQCKNPLDGVIDRFPPSGYRERILKLYGDNNNAVKHDGAWAGSQ